MPENPVTYRDTQAEAMRWHATPKPVEEWRLDAAFRVLSDLIDTSTQNEMALSTMRQTFVELRRRVTWLEEKLAGEASEEESDG